MLTFDDGVEMCGWCGWCAEYPACHVEHSPFCPEVRAKYHVWVDEDGELCWRKRDFLWVVPRLLSWSRRATVRIEAEYAPDGGYGPLHITDLVPTRVVGSSSRDHTTETHVKACRLFLPSVGFHLHLKKLF